MDMSKSFQKTTIIIAALMVVGWISTSSNTDELGQNSWMLVLLLIPTIAYLLLRNRVRDIPEIESNAE